MKQYFELKDEKSSKFWEVVLEGTNINTRYGKIGSNGTSNTKEYDSAEKAEQEILKLINSKISKGYIKVEDSNSNDGCIVENTDQQKFNFPFFGAGKFYKFMHGYVNFNVFFKSLPSKKQWKKIGELIPEYLVHPAFKAYITMGGLEDLCITLLMPKPAKDVINKHFESANDPFEAFSLEIEKTFIAINEISPLVLVSIKDPEIDEGVDKKKKKNTLSNWHYWSLKQVDKIFDLLKDDIYMKELHREDVLSTIFSYLNAENLEYGYDFDAIANGTVSNKKHESKKLKELEETLSKKYYPELKKIIFKASETAFKTLQEIKKTKELGSLIIYVSMNYKNNQIRFRYLDKRSKEESDFYTYQSDSPLGDARQLMQQIEENGGLTYARALWDLFKNAKLYNIKDRYTNFLDFAYQVPEAESDDEDDDNILRYYWGDQEEDEDEDWDDDEDDRAGELFYSEYHGTITGMVSDAVKGALDTLQILKETEKFGFLNIDVNMNWDKGNIEFWYVDKENKKESQFYTYEVGSFMTEAYEVMEQMEEEGGTSYGQALSNFFEDAGLSGIDEELIEGLSFILDVSDVGGSPYMHVVAGKRLY